MTFTKTFLEEILLLFQSFQDIKNNHLFDRYRVTANSNFIVQKIFIETP